MVLFKKKLTRVVKGLRLSADAMAHLGQRLNTHRRALADPRLDRLRDHGCYALLNFLRGQHGNGRIDGAIGGTLDGIGHALLLDFCQTLITRHRVAKTRF